MTSSCVRVVSSIATFPPCALSGPILCARGFTDERIQQRTALLHPLRPVIPIERHYDKIPILPSKEEVLPQAAFLSEQGAESRGEVSCARFGDAGVQLSESP